MNETTEPALLEAVLQPLVCDSFWANVQQDAMWTFATFNIHLPEPVLVEGEPGEPISMAVNLEGFDAEVLLTLNPALGRIKKQGRGASDERWYYAASELEVTISRRETVLEGRQQDHFKSILLPEYQTAAIEAATRSATFLKFRLWSSLFAAMARFDDLYGEGATGQRDDITQRHRFSITPMAECRQDAQQAYFNGHYSPELADALLAEAQQSIIDKRLRRACFELSMACEAAIKQRVVSVDDLKDAIDDGFKSRHQAAYIGLNTLFQARDEEGSRKGFFRFSSTRLRDVQCEQLKEWGASVTCLKNWVMPR